jgi:DNA-binding GntR family transcriptional regulator
MSAGAATAPQPEVPRTELSSTWIYQELRRRIILGDFPPGARLRERELAEEFDVSRIPLREAIPQLEAEGFVTTLPRRGAVVTTLTMRDVDELFEVRLGVEVYANRLAAERVAAGADTSELRAVLERCDEAVSTGDTDRISESNTALHEAIISLSGNTLLQGMLRAAAGRQRWIYRMTGGTDVRVRSDEHHRLCEAILAGDAKLAESLAYAHIARTRKPTVEALQGRLPGSD